MFSLSLNTNSNAVAKSLDVEIKKTNGDLWRYLERKKIPALEGARRMVGVSTGRLRRSISWYHLKNVTGQYVGLKASAPYALMHNEGTRPHLIVPNQGKALRFQQRGVVVFRNAVMHPGTKANPFLRAQLIHFRG
jgi:hypothetical protein